MSTTLQQAAAVQDNDGHWYVIPAYLERDFYKDLEDENMIDRGDFDDKYGSYMTGGDLNLVQLWAEL